MPTSRSVFPLPFGTVNATMAGVVYAPSVFGTTLWHFTQLLFSLFLMIAILAAGNHDTMALPFLVAGLWKFGFPETIGCFLEARTIGFARSAPTERARAACAFLDGLGTLLHHTAGVLLYFTTDPSRFVVDAGLAQLINANCHVLKMSAGLWGFPKNHELLSLRAASRFLGTPIRVHSF